MTTDTFLTAAVTGHTGHGKTSLVQWLTGIDPDRSRDKKPRGQPTEPSFAPFRLASGIRIALVDMPDHSDMPQKTIGGLNTVDLAVLVVAADDVPIPQTRDCLDFLNRLNARGGFVVMSKADLVNHETIALANMEIQDVVEGSFLEKKPIVPFSAVDGSGLDEILATVEGEAHRVGGTGYFDTAHYRSLKRRVLEVATRTLEHDVFRVSVSADELRFQPEPTPDSALLRRMLRELCSAGKLVAINGGYRVPSLSVKLPPNPVKVADQMLEYALNLGYVTFSARTFCELHWKDFNVRAIRQLLEHLRDRKKLVRLNDGRYLTCQAIEDIKEKVRDWILQKGSLTVQGSKEILGYGRNRGVPVLEYLDSIGFTRRIDDARVLRPEVGRAGDSRL
jgi:hypothetical protein